MPSGTRLPTAKNKARIRQKGPSIALRGNGKTRCCFHIPSLPQGKGSSCCQEFTQGTGFQAGRCSIKKGGPIFLPGWNQQTSDSTLRHQNLVDFRNKPSRKKQHHRKQQRRPLWQSTNTALRGDEDAAANTVPKPVQDVPVHSKCLPREGKIPPLHGLSV